MSEFEVGKSYHTDFDPDGNLNLVRKYKVQSRTPKFIFVIKPGQNFPQKLKVKTNSSKQEYVEKSENFPFYLSSVLEAEKVKNRHKFEVGKSYCLAEPVTTRMMKVLSIKKKTAVIECYNGPGVTVFKRIGNIKISRDGFSEYISFSFDETYCASLAAEKIVIADFLKRFL